MKLLGFSPSFVQAFRRPLPDFVAAVVEWAWALEPTRAAQLALGALYSELIMTPVPSELAFGRTTPQLELKLVVKLIWRRIIYAALFFAVWRQPL